MKRILLVILNGVILASAAQAGIDFTATTGERELCGIKFPQLVFHENRRKITYEQPRGWTYSGDGSRIRFTPPNITQAQAQIEQSPLVTPQPFTEEVKQALQLQALQSVPPNSVNVAVLPPEEASVTFYGHETYEVVIDYEAGGQRYTSSVLYTNLPDTQLRFRVSARKSDFEKVHTAFRASLGSWRWASPPAAVTAAR
jgi:hypothetical protein